MSYIIEMSSALCSNLLSVVIYLLILFLTWCFYRIIIYPFISPYRHLKGPPCYDPIFGNMKEAIKEEAMEQTRKWVGQYGTTILHYTFFLGEDRVIIANPEGLKHVFVTHSKNYGRMYTSLTNSIMSRLLGQGVLMLSGDEHNRRRKQLNPAFKFAVIKDMTPTIKSCTENLISLWNEKLSECNNLKLMINKELSRLTLDVIGRCAFGFDFGSITDPNSEKSVTINRLLSLSGLNLKSIIPGFWRLPFKESIQVREDIDTMRKFIMKMIEEKMQALSKQNVTDEKSPKKQDLLDLIILASSQDASGERLSAGILRDEIATFMLAGHETTSVAMMWFLTMMAKHPDIQTRIREEVNQVLPPSGHDMLPQHFEELKYLESAIKETLRLYPPAPITMRRALVDDYIDGHFIPKGTPLILNSGCMMRLPEFYDDPLTFDPDRFSDEKIIDPNKFLPFINGPYMCIGYKFAMLEMKIVLALLLREFKFNCDKNLTWKRTIRFTMKSKEPIELQITKVTSDVKG